MKKIVDEKGRLFGRISLIDLGVLVLACVLMLGLFVSKEVMPDIEDIRYEVSIDNMPQGRLDSICIGDYLYDADYATGHPVGTIVDIRVTDCVIPSQKVDGTYVMGTVDDRTNVVLVLEAKGVMDGEGHGYINRTNEVALGSVVNYYTKACQFVGTVTELG